MRLVGAGGRLLMVSAAARDVERAGGRTHDRRRRGDARRLGPDGDLRVARVARGRDARARPVAAIKASLKNPKDFKIIGKRIARR